MPVPDADPVAIRACLSPELTAIFDAEWEHALEAAKHTKDLVGVRALLAHWRLQAHQELREPGSYFRVLAVAAEIRTTGQARPGNVVWSRLRDDISARLVEAGRDAVPAVTNQ